MNEKELKSVKKLKNDLKNVNNEIKEFQSNLNKAKTEEDSKKLIKNYYSLFQSLDNICIESHNLDKVRIPIQLIDASEEDFEKFKKEKYNQMQECAQNIRGYLDGVKNFKQELQNLELNNNK